MTKTAKKPSRRPSRKDTEPAARPKKAPVEDGLSREEIEAANARGPGAVASLIRAGAKGAKASRKAKVQKAPPTPAAAEPRTRDPRLPKAGTTITRTFQGKEIKVEVLDAGFRHDGKTWRSLSAIAKAVTGTSWNGFLFFGIQNRPAKAPKATSVAKAEAK